MAILDSPGVWVLLIALAGALLAPIHRRWGWMGFMLGSAALVGLTLAVGSYRPRVGPILTTPPRLNWLCIATPLPVAAAATLALLALTAASLQLPKAPLQQHVVLNVAVSAIASVIFILLTAFMYAIGYLGCDTV